MEPLNIKMFGADDKPIDACVCSPPTVLHPQSDAASCVDVCCGPPPAPPSSDREKPGYQIRNFVDEFLNTSAGLVPRVKTRLDGHDHFGTFLARSTGVRDNYKIAPGLYCTGSPNPESPVLVSANYKLSFDVLRKSLDGLDAWILALDTRGINVWCAAGKKLFGTDELCRQIEKTNLKSLVGHRELILPQLSATGVSAVKVKKQSGFSVVWGPVNAADIRKFLKNGKKAAPGMREVTFSLMERLVLIPVELSILKKYIIPFAVALIALSGIGPHIFSLSAAWSRGLLLSASLLGGVAAGAVLTPALLPWIPGRAFSTKGVIMSAIAGLIVTGVFWNSLAWLEIAAVCLLAGTVGSYLAMNFTGSTPYTSPSGVEKEMRKAIPLQALAGVAAAVIWIAAPFIR